MPETGPPDFAALRQRAQRLADDLRFAQEELTGGSTTGHAAGGLVTAAVRADGLLVELRIDPAVIDPEDPQGLAELVLTAAQHAHRTAVEQRAEQLGAVSEQLNGILDGIRRAGRPVLPPLPKLPRPPAVPPRPRREA
ncbi:YbaB/EbfC family nucleoid-associated protein [Kitasatospora sp. NPDC058965]|uniref:YbaB/EbfC family nucleoid-associated protein n=1 Tax=Kitasatospora sp. NPDC058965 TaxID=3346682 RepID=UPI00369757D1